MFLDLIFAKCAVGVIVRLKVKIRYETAAIFINGLYYVSDIAFMGFAGF